MKHAGKETLASLEPLLSKLRKVRSLNEKKLGVFYRKSSTFLHFHEDPQGLFADLRLGNDGNRYPVNTNAQRKVLIEKVETIMNAA